MSGAEITRMQKVLVTEGAQFGKEMEDHFQDPNKTMDRVSKTMAGPAELLGMDHLISDALAKHALAHQQESDVHAALLDREYVGNLFLDID